MKCILRSENSTLHSYDLLLVCVSRHHCRMKRSDTWKYGYICSSLREALRLRDIVKSRRTRGTREETRKREERGVGAGRERISFTRLLAARFARPNRRACICLQGTFAGSLDYEQSLSFFLARQAERARDENDQGYYSESKRWPLSSAALVSRVSLLYCLTLARACTPLTKSELAV